MSIDQKIVSSPWPPVPPRPTMFQRAPFLLQKVRGVKWLGVAALILVLGGFWYVNHRGITDQPRSARGAAAPVKVAKVERRDMSVIERTIGTVLASDTIQVTPQVAGRVQQAFFKEGQMVKKGDLLFQIDPRPFEAALAQVRGQLTKDQAALEGARRDLKRFQALLSENAISQQVVDDEAATAAADGGIVEADQANLQTAELNLEYTKIRSPVDGKTGPITIMPGNIISVTGTTTNVNPLVTISQIQPIKISFFLPQTDLPRIEARQKIGSLLATVDQSDVGGANFTVPVNFVSNAVNNATGTIELRATYDNADASLVPGQLVNVVVELASIKNAITVPHDALASGPDAQYVYRVAGGKAEQIAVTVLFDDSKNVAIQGNLAAGDDVVVDGQLEVVPGGNVEIVRGAQAGGGGRNGAGRRGAQRP
ncbi:MAG TPA: efflux RND transporter periplasmic adaptor subunit [Rhizomicrobium sp.]|jgi:multidrug efflux system membrane fusion protein|nr:efflux RND transporter periplasmic adaptor subunit [Rhizomicrobium sp.]